MLNSADRLTPTELTLLGHEDRRQDFESAKRRLKDVLNEPNLDSFTYGQARHRLFIIDQLLTDDQRRFNTEELRRHAQLQLGSGYERSLFDLEFASLSLVLDTPIIPCHSVA
jgi:hypothetical protein